jgi:HTH-type transcriptional regulator/antitoxin HigA
MTNRTIAPIAPGEYLREELIAREWTPEHLAALMDPPLAAVNQIIIGAIEVTPEIAQKIAQAMGTSTVLWVNLESAYRRDLERHASRIGTAE